MKQPTPEQKQAKETAGPDKGSQEQAQIETSEKDAVEEPAQKEKSHVLKEGDQLVVAGILTVEKNHFYIVPPEKGVWYRLVGLKKEEKAVLMKFKGKTITAEIKILTLESPKAYNTQLIYLK